MTKIVATFHICEYLGWAFLVKQMRIMKILK